MKKIEIKAGVLFYNRPKYLERCVRSLIQAGYREQDIVIYDNGSDLEKYEEARILIDQQIEFNRIERNIGYAKNFVRAFEDLDSEYIMLIHDDDEVFHNFLKEQNKIFEMNNQIDILSCNGYFIDDNSKYHNSKVLKNEKSGLLSFKNKTEIALHIFSNSCIPFSPIIYKKQTVLKTMNLFVEMGRKYGQAIDAAYLWSIAEELNIKINYMPIYGCRIHKNQDSQNLNNEFEDSLREDIIKHLSNSNKKYDYSAIRTIKANYTVNIIISFCKKILHLENPFQIRARKSLLTINFKLISLLLGRLILRK